MTTLSGGETGDPPLRVASFPPTIPQNPYQRLLYRHLADEAVALVEDAALHLTWLARSPRPADVLHFHWPQSYYLASSRPRWAQPPLSWARLVLFATRLLFARAAGYRLVWTVHQPLPHERPVRGVDRAAAHVLARAAHALVAHDVATARATERILHRRSGSVVVVPHGSFAGCYPPGRPRQEARDRLGIAANARVFLSFGHLRAYKEVGLLLEAFAAVARSDAVLVVAGLPLDGDAARVVADAAAKDARILPLLGFVAEERVAELFEAADVAVLARGDGGTSGALVLALSLGLPVVVADRPAYRELTGDSAAGWLFAPGDTRSLATAMEAAAADVEARAAKAAAARELARRLDWAAHAAELARLMRGDGERADLLLACSSGGHLLQLLALRPAWQGFSRVWATDDRPDTRSLLAGERVVFGHWPTSRNLGTLLKNLRVAWRTVRTARPRVVLTTGAATAVPFAWVARLHGARVIYVESLTRIASPSLSCRLIAPIAERVYVQWPELRHAVRSARYAGSVLGR